MGIFNFFKLNNYSSDGEKNLASLSKIFAIKADPELFPAYSEIFLKEMATIKSFSNEDINAMHEFISNGEGGFLNQGRYHKFIFENYFKGREWLWPEYEKWKNIFSNLNEWPGWRKWERSSAIEELQTKDILELLTAHELKELLIHHGICVPSKSNKQALVALVLKQPLLVESIPDSPTWSKACETYSKRRCFALYSMLMRTIYGRAMCLHDFKRQSKLGISKRKLLLAYEVERKFTDMVLAENPNALTPLFPGNLSVWRAVIPELER